jgi:hypothetical protein
MRDDVLRSNDPCVGLLPSPRVCQGGGTKHFTLRTFDPCVVFCQAPKHVEGEGTWHGRKEDRSRDTTNDYLKLISIWSKVQRQIIHSCNENYSTDRIGGGAPRSMGWVRLGHCHWRWYVDGLITSVTIKGPSQERTTLHAIGLLDTP